MRMNKKYPEAYSAGKALHTLSRRSILSVAVRMNAQQGSSFDDDDGDEEMDDIEGSITSEGRRTTGAMMVKSKTIDATSLSSSSSLRESQTCAQLSTSKNENAS